MLQTTGMRKNLKTKFASVGLATLLLASALGGTAAAQGNPHQNCKPVELPVAIVKDGPVNNTISGKLCTPRKGNIKTVDVLVHGATYSGNYWDFPGYYSYVQRSLNSHDTNRAVFVYDRLGTGNSSRPVSTEVGMDADSQVLHQIIQWTRSAKHFRQVNVIGHSFGSMIAVQESALYNDADRLVLTGFLHSVGPALINGELKKYAAEQDPLFAGKGYDDGYQTTVPGARGVFYDTAAADPVVIAYDEAHKDVHSTTQFVQGKAQQGTPAGSNLTNQITVPVMIIDGANDRLYCNVQVACADTAAVRAFEAPYYTKAKSLKVVTIPNTGHDIALHPSAARSFREIDNWLKRTN